MNDPVLNGQKRKMKCHLFSLPSLFTHKKSAFYLKMIWGFSSNSEQGQYLLRPEDFEGKCKGLRVCPQLVLCLHTVRIGNGPEELIPAQSDNGAEPRMVHLSILSRVKVSLSLHIFLHLAML